MTTALTFLLACLLACLVIPLLCIAARRRHELLEKVDDEKIDTLASVEAQPIKRWSIVRTREGKFALRRNL